MLTVLRTSCSGIMTKLSRVSLDHTVFKVVRRIFFFGKKPLLLIFYAPFTIYAIK